MAIEVPPKSVWGGGKSVVVSNMQQAAQNDWVWRCYLELDPMQRMRFQAAVKQADVVPIAAIRRSGESKSAPMPARVMAPQPAALKRGPTQREFTTWLQDQCALVGAHSGLAFGYGTLQVLSDGTVAQAIHIVRHGSKVRYTDFVFHYHPGVKGPSVGHGYGSKWHFKPYDSAPKHCRVEEHSFSTLDVALVRTVKDKVRSLRLR